MAELSDARIQPSRESLIALRVLLVEDQAEVAAAMQLTLQRAGMQTAWARSGAEALAAVPVFKPAIVLVDLELPDTNGFPLIQWLVTNSACGIIVVTGHGDETDRIIGLESGADDYIAKPASPRELVARIRAVHRRLNVSTAPPVAIARRSVIPVGQLLVDMERRRATKADGSEARLTTAEFDILAALIEADGLPVSRTVLSQKALRKPWVFEDRSVDQLIHNLRRRLAESGGGRQLIQSVRSGGYRLCLAPFMC